MVFFFFFFFFQCLSPLIYVSEFCSEAGATFNNSFFDNCFGFLRQFKNRLFLDPVFVHVTGRSQNSFSWSKSELIEVKCCPV